MTNREACVNWIKEYFKDNPDGKAIIGISGGKDSTIAAALCVEALGADRVIGVLMPQEKQNDISDSYEVVARLKLQYHVVNIGSACEELYRFLADAVFLSCGDKAIRENSMITTNTPARLRMTVLYAVAALYPNSRVVNTCNASEDYVGYSTKFGDAAGDFSPLGNLTVREVLEIGDELGLPERLVHKAPSDGMCGKTDEDNLGFTYEQLDDYILGTAAVDEKVVEKIERLHKATRHKYEPMPTFYPLRLDVYSEQLSLFDNDKQRKRGLRAQCNLMEDCANGGLLNDANISGNIGSFTIDPLYHSTPSYDNINLEELANTMQKVINTAGCGLLRRNNE